MCMSCGCQAPDVDHGDPDNITADDLGALDEESIRKAADARGLTVEEVQENVEHAKRYV